MKRRIVGISLLAAAMVLSAPTAFGFGKKKNNCNSCGPVYQAPCATGYAAPYTISYVEKKVMVNEWVKAKEDYKYWVNEPETKKTKVKVKELKNKEEEYKYTVTEWETAKEKVKVGEWKPVTKEVEVVSYTWQPKVTKQPRTVCEWVCVPVQVTCAAPPPCSSRRRGLCGRNRNNCGSPCGSPCGAPCPAPVMVKTVMQRQMVTKTVEMNVTTYDRIEKKEKKPVTTYEMAWLEKEVEVKKPKAVEKTGKHMVGVWVDVEKEVNVTTYKKVEKTGTHEVWKTKQVEKTVKVPVYTPAPAPAPAPMPTPSAVPYVPCSTCTPVVSSGGCCGGKSRGGLFRGRNRGGCCY